MRVALSLLGLRFFVCLITGCFRCAQPFVVAGSMGIDLEKNKQGRTKNTARTAPKSQNVYLALLVKVCVAVGFLYLTSFSLPLLSSCRRTTQSCIVVVGLWRSAACGLPTSIDPDHTCPPLSCVDQLDAVCGAALCRRVYCLPWGRAAVRFVLGVSLDERVSGGGIAVAVSYRLCRGVSPVSVLCFLALGLFVAALDASTAVLMCYDATGAPRERG